MALFIEKREKWTDAYSYETDRVRNDDPPKIYKMRFFQENEVGERRLKTEYTYELKEKRSYI